MPLYTLKQMIKCKKSVDFSYICIQNEDNISKFHFEYPKWLTQPLSRLVSSPPGLLAYRPDCLPTARLGCSLSELSAHRPD